VVLSVRGLAGQVALNEVSLCFVELQVLFRGVVLKEGIHALFFALIKGADHIQGSLLVLGLHPGKGVMLLSGKVPRPLGALISEGSVLSLGLLYMFLAHTSGVELPVLLHAGKRAVMGQGVDAQLFRVGILGGRL
jgi:hypothetical protein